nr:hypothetical protein [Hydrogenophilus thermoluteolus]
MTTDPAPTIAFVPIVTPGKITAPPPDGSSFLNNRLEKGTWVHFGAGKFVIGKGHVWANEHIILHAQTIPKLNTIFDGDAVTNNHVILNKYMGANITIVPNLGSRQDHNELPDRGAFTDLCRQHIS